jgi:hypothetical protein
MMKSRFALLSLMMLAGCAADGQGGYPSLSKRPVEAQAENPVDEGAVPHVTPAEPAEPALLTRLEELTRQAKEAGATFEQLYAENAGRIRVASSAEVSSESWVAAHVLLGKMEHAQYGSATALASLDALYAARMRDMADGKARGGAAEIEAARWPVLALVDSQNDRMDALRAVLREP